MSGTVFSQSTIVSEVNKSLADLTQEHRFHDLFVHLLNGFYAEHLN